MSKKSQATPRVKVLYQNLNGTWYAFAENGGELYFGKVPAQVSEKKSKSAKKTRSRTAHSADQATGDSGTRTKSTDKAA